MGQLMGILTEPLQACGDGVANMLKSGRKRKRSKDFNSAVDDQKYLEVQTPKK